MDVVGTVPMDVWLDWLLGSQCDCNSYRSKEYYWYQQLGDVGGVNIGDRLYMVVEGKLRGYAVIKSIQDFGVKIDPPCKFLTCDDVVEVTIDEKIKDFRGLRHRWWNRKEEKSKQAPRQWESLRKQAYKEHKEEFDIAYQQYQEATDAAVKKLDKVVDMLNAEEAV